MAMQPETLFVVPRPENRVARRRAGTLPLRWAASQSYGLPAPGREVDGPTLLARLGEVKARLLANLQALALSTERDAIIHEATLSLPTHVAMRKADAIREVGITARRAGLLMLQQQPPAQHCAGGDACQDPVAASFHTAMHSLTSAAPQVARGPAVPFPSLCCRWCPSPVPARPRGRPEAPADSPNETLTRAVYNTHHSMVRYMALWAEFLTVLGVWLAGALLVLGAGGSTATAALSPLLDLPPTPSTPVHLPLSVSQAGMDALLCLPLCCVVVGAMLNCYLCLGRTRLHRTPAPSSRSSSQLTSSVAAHSTAWWLREVLAVYGRYQRSLEALRAWQARQPPPPTVGPVTPSDEPGMPPTDDVAEDDLAEPGLPPPSSANSADSDSQSQEDPCAE